MYILVADFHSNVAANTRVDQVSYLTPLRWGFIAIAIALIAISRLATIPQNAIPTSIPIPPTKRNQNRRFLGNSDSLSENYQYFHH